ncbi:MAG: NifB/NifX family molybdenum-iron cluster-binding protein [Bacillota bacterium]
MKLAVCAKGEGLKAEVDQRFGRCPFFVVVDTEKSEVIESISNENAQAAGGAGPQAAQLLAGRNVEAVVLGNVGPNAIEALKAAKVKVYSGVTGTVEDTLKKFLEGSLKLVAEANVSSHSGMQE